MSKPLQEAFVSVLLICLSMLLYFWLIPTYVPEKAYSEMSPRFFPIFGTVLIGTFSLFLFCLSMLRMKGNRIESLSVSDEEKTKKSRPFVIVMTLSIFIIVFDLFGFLIAAPITIGLLMLVFGQKKPIGLFLSSLAITGTLYVVFNYGLNLSL